MTREWVQMVAGAWLIVSPWVLGFNAITFALWNGVVVGLALVLINLWAIFGERSS